MIHKYPKADIAPACKIVCRPLYMAVILIVWVFVL